MCTPTLWLRQLHTHTNSYYYSFVPNSISYWNALPESVVQVLSLSAFKVLVVDDHAAPPLSRERAVRRAHPFKSSPTILL